MTGKQLLERLWALTPEQFAMPVTSEDLESYNNELTDVEITDSEIQLTFNERAPSERYIPRMER